MKYKCIYILFPFLFIQCKPESGNIQYQSERCNCPLEKDKDGNIRTQYEHRRDTNYEWGIEGKLSPTEFIKEALKVEADLYYKGKNTNEHIKTVIKDFKEQFPEIRDYTNFRKEFFCAFIEIICVDSTITTEELAKMKLEKLEVIEAAIEAKYLDDNTHVPPQIPIPSSPKVEEKKEPEKKEVSCQIRGTVYDSTKKNPVANALVVIENGLDSTRTNPQGYYQLDFTSKYPSTHRYNIAVYVKNSLKASKHIGCDGNGTIKFK